MNMDKTDCSPVPRLRAITSDTRVAEATPISTPAFEADKQPDFRGTTCIYEAFLSLHLLGVQGSMQTVQPLWHLKSHWGDYPPFPTLIREEDKQHRGPNAQTGVLKVPS